MPKPMFQAAAEGLPNRRQFLGKLAVAPVIAVPLIGSASGSALETHPDARLLTLGRELQIAWAREKAACEVVDRQYSHEADEQWEAANEVSTAIVSKIEASQAVTLEGLAVKALAISWTHCGDPIEDDSFNDQATRDVRLAASIVRDLLSHRISPRAQTETV